MIIKEVILDGKKTKKLLCPKCGVWGYIDDDQFHGRVSILCECGFHETVNCSSATKDEITIKFK